MILASVFDVKHLKAKIRPDSEHTVNSPWNIAADFNVRMSFDEADVAGMLKDYETDHATGMNIAAIVLEIIVWAGGYPFLASRICQLMDERELGWNSTGVGEAVRLLLRDDNVALFESLMGQLERRPKLKDRLRRVIMFGEEIAFSPYDETQKLLRMYGFCTVQGSRLTVANRVFETLLCDYFVVEEQGGMVWDAGVFGRSRLVRKGHLDMCAVLEGFRATYGQVFGPLTNRFPEKDGRELFLLYLKPIINGTGNYYIEAVGKDGACESANGGTSREDCHGRGDEHGCDSEGALGKAERERVADDDRCANAGERVPRSHARLPQDRA